MDLKLKIIPKTLLSNYLLQVDKNLEQNLHNLHDSELSIDTFSFYTSVSAVFSSKIEGEHIELDSYIKHKRFGIEFLPNYTLKIDDLYNAYQFAKTNQLNKNNLENAHQLLTKNILPKSRQGKIRNSNMYVTTPDGKIEYVAASPFIVEKDLQKLYHDVEVLLNTDLSVNEVFFFASFIHLMFVKIHPFDDGNGRTARLLEKWFLSEKLGESAWFIQSEKHYYSQHQIYYKNLRLLGLEYDLLDFDKSIPFLLMLTDCLEGNFE